VLKEERGSAVAVRGEAGSAAVSFYSRGKGGNPAGALHAELARQPMAVRERSRRGLGRQDSRPIG
jgi:hypothetical protein